MTKAETIAIEQATNGTPKMYENQFYKATGIFGSYYYRIYVRAYNKTVREIKSNSLDQSLVSRLRTETESLRVQYIEKTKEYAAAMFAKLERVASRSYPSYSDFATPNFAGHIDYAQGKNYRKAVDAIHNAKKTTQAGYEKFEAREVELAERHYTQSIEKLAARIEQKELNQSNLTMNTGHVGVNIETVLTDGVKSVKAWTIIASGPCVRPHYRYLVK